LFMGGNITFEDGGTFGGRDLSVDGEKLDEIAPFVNQDVTTWGTPSFVNINSTIGIYHDCNYPGDPYYLWCYPYKHITPSMFYEEGAYARKILMWGNGTEWPQQTDYPVEYPFANFIRVGNEITFWTCVQWDHYYSFPSDWFITVTAPVKYQAAIDDYPITFSYVWGLQYNFAGPGYEMAAMSEPGYPYVWIGSVYKTTGAFHGWTGTQNGMGNTGQFCVSGTYPTLIGGYGWDGSFTKKTPWFLEPEYLERINRERDDRTAKLKEMGWKKPEPNPARPARPQNPRRTPTSR